MEAGGARAPAPGAAAVVREGCALCGRRAAALGRSPVAGRLLQHAGVRRDGNESKGECRVFVVGQDPEARSHRRANSEGGAFTRENNL